MFLRHVPMHILLRRAILILYICVLGVSLLTDVDINILRRKL